MPTKKLTLEEFETRRGGRGDRKPHHGKAAKFLLTLEPLTPTVFEGNASTPQFNASALIIQWAGYGHSVPVQPIRGGDIRTSIIDDKLYVVWYPSDNGKH